VTTVSSKNQVTIPVGALHAAGLRPGDRLRVVASAPGRVEFQRIDDPLDRFSGALTGVYRPDELDRLRREWD
jgi:bifunctional DNA-binding transcriptional regulator/antitoxin component of YhaV-PrlF toxin-antitoxin module